MLFFTGERGPTESMRMVSELFDREYDQYAYEEKIGFVVRSLQKRQTAEERQAWHDALTAMGDGDHYLSVLIDGAKGRRRGFVGPGEPMVPDYGFPQRAPQGRPTPIDPRGLDRGGGAAGRHFLYPAVSRAREVIQITFWRFSTGV